MDHPTPFIAQGQSNGRRALKEDVVKAFANAGRVVQTRKWQVRMECCGRPSRIKDVS